MTNNLSWEEFTKVDMRVGTIVDAQSFPEARRPAYKLTIDFGNELGIRKTSAQITDHYNLEDLIGKQIIAVVNFPKKQIANFMSECLVLGSVDSEKRVILLQPDQQAVNGDRVG
ncbi:tRNA-binding protein [Nonlabens marinus]|uniref:Protein secretion chaperonin CsaA n=1 Tax=Nonlabens marinus S1-08 TaxID=1454201 RepID=W8VRB4_9FLAO|nr:tRNA-binding protein [Nonlabens marinus]BAO55560.1 protein secretion chaperonin CsaA [Nonlabens marinus S1-08]